MAMADCKRIGSQKEIRDWAVRHPKVIRPKHVPSTVGKHWNGTLWIALDSCEEAEQPGGIDSSCNVDTHIFERLEVDDVDDPNSGGTARMYHVIGP